MLVDNLRKKLPSVEIQDSTSFGPVLICSSNADLPEVCRILKTDPTLGFDVLEDQTAVDTGTQFMIVMHLVSSRDIGRRLTVKVPVERERPEIPTLAFLYGCADWYEREIYDMFGIKFKGHPDLCRILLPEEWQGYPLRKDYTDDKLLKRPGV
ncbi:NADH-quinone oxidoreductase subunit C [bacterium]|nr:NADH-quinone oxidoreductase subunit C [bacterium]